MLRSIFLS